MKPLALCYFGSNGKPVTRVFNQPSITIGRSKDNLLAIPGNQAEKLSRYHAVLEWQGDDELVITDLGSLNGTEVNGQLVAGSSQVLPGDTLVIGKEVTMQVHWESPRRKKESRGVSRLLFPLWSEVDLTRDFDTFEKHADGAHGSIWKARGPGVKSWRAVKLLHFEHGAGERKSADRGRLKKILERFRREGDILGSFAMTPGVYVVRAHQTGLTKDGTTYIVMDFVEGTNLRDLVLDLHPLPIDSILSWFYDVSFSIKAAHEFDYKDPESEKKVRGIVHRDVRPSNILIEDGSSHALLCDFGIAGYVEGGERLTKIQDLVSNLHHTPPEAFFERIVDPVIDLWALAASFYLACSGMIYPYEGTKPQDLHDNIRKGKLRPLNIHRNDIPLQVMDLLVTSLSFNPEDRPRVSDWVETLFPWAREPSGTAFVRARR